MLFWELPNRATILFVIMLLLVSGELRPAQREACRQAVMALALEAVLHPVLQVCYCIHGTLNSRLHNRHLLFGT